MQNYNFTNVEIKTSKVGKCKILAPTNVSRYVAGKVREAFLKRNFIFKETKDLLFGAFTFEGHQMRLIQHAFIFFSCRVLGVVSKKLVKFELHV